MRKGFLQVEWQDIYDHGLETATALAFVRMRQRFEPTFVPSKRVLMDEFGVGRIVAQNMATNVCNVLGMAHKRTTKAALCGTKPNHIKKTKPNHIKKTKPNHIKGRNRTTSDTKPNHISDETAPPTISIYSISFLKPSSGDFLPKFRGGQEIEYFKYANRVREWACENFPLVAALPTGMEWEQAPSDIARFCEEGSFKYKRPIGIINKMDRLYRDAFCDLEVTVPDKEHTYRMVAEQMGNNTMGCDTFLQYLVQCMRRAIVAYTKQEYGFDANERTNLKFWSFCDHVMDTKWVYETEEALTNH